MVARQDAEPAGVKRQRTVDSVFSAKVSDGSCGRDRSGEMKIGRRARVTQVGIKTRGQLSYALCVCWIGGPFRNAKVRSLRQLSARIVLALFPNIFVKIAKGFRPIGRPAPPVIPGQAFERLEIGGQFAPAQ